LTIWTKQLKKTFPVYTSNHVWCSDPDASILDLRGMPVFIDYIRYVNI